MSPAQLCLCCARFALPGGSRCELHALPKRTGTYRRNAIKTLTGATYCYICGGPFTEADAAVCDHIRPRVLGGTDDLDDLAPAHRSCNGRKAARFAGH
jgi:5-methylcytosine-specific restriction endonuclease McrA